MSWPAVAAEALLGAVVQLLVVAVLLRDGRQRRSRPSAAVAGLVLAVAGAQLVQAVALVAARPGAGPGLLGALAAGDGLALLAALCVLAVLAQAARATSAAGKADVSAAAGEVPPGRGGRRQAMELNDDVVQSLAVAMYALDLGDSQRARAAVERSLTLSRSMLSDQLGERGTEGRLGAGDLVRRRPPVRLPERTTGASQR